MTNKENEIWDVISSVLNGEAAIEKKRMLDEWLNESEENRILFERFSKLGYDRSNEKALLVKDKIFNKIENRMNDYSSRRVVRLWQFVAAASVSLLIVTGSLFFRNGEKEKEVASIETRCPMGVTSKVALSDGTVVNLNAGSELVYPAVFIGDSREVILKGEAYFEVATDKKHPFIVKVPGVNIKVLGTHFNVKAYSDENIVTTTLIEGSVSLIPTISGGGEHREVILKPNQQAVFSRVSRKIVTQQVKAELVASWKEGDYYFEGERFIYISQKLERGFNVKINIESDRLKNEIFSGVFDRGENLQQILDLMKRHRNFDYKITGSEIEIFEQH